MTRQSSDRGKGLAFAGAVAVLAAVGVYLTMSPSSEGDGTARPLATDRPDAATMAPPPAPTPSQVATTPAGFDVYAYLPLTREELGAAADLARRFTESYGTFRYDEDPRAFADRLRALATDEFAAQLTRTVTDPGLAERNRADQVVSRATAKVATIRDITARQVVFVVDSTQHVTNRQGDRDQTEQYAVTVIKMGDDWRIYDLGLASDGQDGDTSP